PALPGLGALGHLDLQFLGIHEIDAGDTESPGSHLLDRAILRIAVRFYDIALRILATFTRVALAAYSVHGNGERLMRFLADRAIGHRAGLEALHDRFDRLHFIDWNRWTRGLEFHKSAQGAESLRLVVDKLAILLECLVIAGAAGVLQLVDSLRVE